MAEDLDDVETLLNAARRSVVLFFDADNTLAAQGVSLEVFRRRVTSALDRFRGNEHVVRVVVLTNGPERGVPGMIPRANKPWTTRRRLGLTRDDEVWVVGDQVLTDGLLAWRLGAVFVHLALDVEGEGARQALMRRAGSMLRDALFEPLEV